MFKKPNQKSITDNGIAIVGGIAGGMASRVVLHAIAGEAPDDKAPVEEVTKQKNMSLYASAGITILSIVGAASVTGSDATSSATKGALVGMAVTQGLELARKISNNTEKAIANKTARIAVGLKGLGCACEEKALNSYHATPMLSYPGLGYSASAPMVERNNRLELSQKSNNLTL